MRGMMQDEDLPDATVVEAAQSGDQQALDTLVRGYLPLVYNVVGRALNGHSDVDDIVQETLLRATHRIADLRDPSRFRSWLIAIAMHQVRDHRRAARDDIPFQPEVAEAADSQGDFVDLTILRLSLSGQRRETAEATRWLDAEECALLSLWWQEAAGVLSRSELAEAVGVSSAHAGVRVQRLKNRLDGARRVVRALAARPRCPGLAEVVADWDGRPNALWRKRVARHIHTCARCAGHAAELAPAEGLLAGLALVPLPVGYVVSAQLLAGAGAGAGGGGGAVAAADGAGRLAGVLTLKHAALAAAGLTVVAVGVGGSVGQWGANPEPPAAVAPPAVADPAPESPSPTAEPPPEPSGESSGAPPASPRFVYGQTVDSAEPAPDPGTRPGPLPERPESTPVAAEDGWYRDASGGGYLMTYRDQYVVLSGRGYLRVDYQLGHDGRRGPMVMPTWTGLEGRIFHVASGCGHRMDDALPGEPEGTTWMGSPEAGFMVLPEGAQQMWQCEYFYLDGQVTLTQHERGSDYNLVVHPVTHADIAADVNRAPGSAPDVVRYGLVRDTGDDSAPVPQYLTRDRPTDPVAEVPQRSRVRPD